MTRNGCPFLSTTHAYANAPRPFLKSPFYPPFICLRFFSHHHPIEPNTQLCLRFGETTELMTPPPPPPHPTPFMTPADLGTGIYHWYVDNYGDENTPIFGRQIAAFQGHHRQPWTITEREFCNNVYLVFRPVAPLAGAVLLASPFLDGSTDVFLGCFAWFVCMSQQFHAWSHMKKSQLPSPIVYLQEKGLLISRKMHGAHHLAPFEGNYCIVSGLWNPVLDQEGDENNFFRSLERIVHQITGHEPRCCSDPEDWHEVAYDGPNASVSESMDQDLS